MRLITTIPLRTRKEGFGPPSQLQRAQLARRKAEERHRWATGAWIRAEILGRDVARRREFVRELREKLGSPAPRDAGQP